MRLQICPRSLLETIMSVGQMSFSRAVRGAVAVLSLTGGCASAQTLGKFSGGAHVRLASIGLGLSLVAFVLGALYLRRVGADALKYLAMAAMTVSLGCLVAACGTTSAPTDYALDIVVTGLAGGNSLKVIDEDMVGVSLTLSGTTTMGTLETEPLGTAYNAVLTPPTGQACTFPNSQTSESGTMSMSGVSSTITCVTATGYTVTGTVTGLEAGTTLGITDAANGGSITVSGQMGAMESFILDQNQASGKDYGVTLTVPSGQFCTITNGVASGTITANVVLGITCTTTAVYPVSVTVTGLPTTTPPTFTVSDTANSGSVLVTGNGTFVVDAGLAPGKSYTVSFTSPNGESCVFSSPNSGTSVTGMVGSAAVSLAIACSTTPVYSVSVAVTGLPTTTPPTFTVTDTGNSGTVTVTGNGTFAVDSGLTAGKSYTISFTSPSGETCTFTSNSLTSVSGTIGPANVTLNIGCSSSSFMPIALNGPGGLVFDSAGNLYVANGGGNEVLVYSETGASSSAPTLTETGAITNGINNPTRLAFDAAGYLYVTNLGNNTVTVYLPSNPNTIVQTISNGITRPLGIAVDQLGNVYVGNNSANTISMYSGSPTSGFTLAATYANDYLLNQFLAPGALMFNAFGGLNDLFIGLGPGGSTNTVYVYTAPFTALTYPTGNINNSGCSAGPSGPTGIATKGYGGSAASTLIYVTSYYNNSVSAYSLSSFSTIGTCPTPVAVSGSGSQISSPEGVAVDTNGNVFVANAGNNTITVYTSIIGVPAYIQH
jgi:hypothetical protein